MMKESEAYEVPLKTKAAGGGGVRNEERARGGEGYAAGLPYKEGWGLSPSLPTSIQTGRADRMASRPLLANRDTYHVEGVAESRA
jgi:hypothetical protein